MSQKEEVWTSTGLSTQDLPPFLLSSPCLQGRSLIQTYVHGQNGLHQDGLWSKLDPQPPLWEFGIGTERFPSVWLFLETGETSTGQLLEVAIAHQVDSEAEKSFYRASGRKGMRGRHEGSLQSCGFCWYFLPEAKLLAAFEIKRTPCNFPIRSPVCLCYLKSYSVTCSQKSSS